MEERKVYCDECEFLQERKIRAEVPIDSGNYIITGKRFYCDKCKKWWPLNTSLYQISYSYCIYGKKLED